MKSTIRAAAVAVLLLAGCGAEALAPAAIMILTNTWREEGNDNHTFNLQDDTGFEAKASGTFTGTETLPNGTQYPLTGSWSNSRVRFTVNRSTAVTYTARITEDNTDRLEFSSSAGPLVLVRN